MTLELIPCLHIKIAPKKFYVFPGEKTNLKWYRSRSKYPLGWNLYLENLYRGILESHDRPTFPVTKNVLGQKKHEEFRMNKVVRNTF